jgi:uncharacterized membrane-anchored protein YitT (DUF2179 family)
MMVIAVAINAISTRLFIAPNSIVAGGITGLALVLNILNENIPIGTATIVINLPILLLGIRFQGWKLILRCLITIVTFGVITDIFVFLPAMINDSVLASLYGGVCQGLSLGLILKYEFSTGGTELLARIISRLSKFIKIPVCVAILDGAVVVVGAIVTKNPANMLYALIMVFVSAKVSDMVLTGLEKSKLCIIVTDKGTEVSKTLIERIPRGVTMLDGVGMYTGQGHDVVMTCVKSRQLTALKAIIKEVDNKAFMIINDTVEVHGQGFQSLV